MRAVSGRLLTMAIALPLISVGAIRADALEPGEARLRLEEGARLLTDAEYDSTIALATAVRDSSRGDLGVLEDAYLLLIEAYVVCGNSHENEWTTSQALYDRAAALVLECLSTKGLGHVEPDEGRPVKMRELFERVRQRHFGGFRVVELDPPQAVVSLDEVPVKGAATSALPDVADLPVGPHKVVVEADGYLALRETVEISPGTTSERVFLLERGKTFGWWARRAGILAGVAGLGFIGGGGGSAPVPPGSLPTPPDPPSN